MNSTPPELIKTDSDASFTDYISFPVILNNIDSSLSHKKYRQIYKCISSRCGPYELKKGFCRPRYLRSYNQNSVMWSCFQAHRQIFGLLGFSQRPKTSSSLTKILDKFEQLKKRHTETLIHSHLFFIDFSEPKIKFSKTSFSNEIEPVLVLRRAKSMDESDNRLELPQLHDDMAVSPHLKSLFSSADKDKRLSFSFLSSRDDFEQELGTFVDEFCYQIGCILYSRVFNWFDVNTDTPMSLTPIETETQSYSKLSKRDLKKFIIGRNRKYLGDLSLLIGCFERALALYQVAYELIRELDDFYWIGGILEGYVIANHFALKEKIKFTPKKPFPKFTDDFLENIKQVLEIYGKTEWSNMAECELTIVGFNYAFLVKDIRGAHYFLDRSIRSSMSTKRIDKGHCYIQNAQFYRLLKCKRKSGFFQRLHMLDELSFYVDDPKTKEDACRAHALIQQSADVFGIFDDSGNSYTVWPLLVISIIEILLKSVDKMLECGVFGENCAKSAALYYIRFGLYQLYRHSALHSNDAFSELIDLLPEVTADASPVPPLPAQFPNFSDSQPALTDVFVICDINYHYLPSNLIPHNSEKQEKTTSPFIYTPNMKTADKVVWVKQCASVVELQLLNPHPFDLQFCQFKPKVSGVEVFIPSISFSIPAYSRHSTPLRVLPLCTGMLHIDGINMTFLGIEVFVPLQPNFVTPVVQVVDELPLLFLIQDFQTPTREVAFDFEQHSVQLSLIVFANSTLYTSVCLYNASEVTIQYIEHSTKPKISELFEFSVLSSDTTPIAPNSKFMVKFAVRDRPDGESDSNKQILEHTIMYSSTNNWHRSLLLVIQLERRTALTVKQFDIRTCGPPYRRAQIVLSISSLNRVTVSMGENSPIELDEGENKQFVLEMNCLDSEKMSLNKDEADKAVLESMRAQLPISCTIHMDEGPIDSMFDISTIPWMSRQLSAAYYSPFGHSECKFNGPVCVDTVLQIGVDEAVVVEASICDIWSPELIKSAYWGLKVRSDKSDLSNSDFLCIGMLSKPANLEPGMEVGRYSCQLIFLKKGSYVLELELTLQKGVSVGYYIDSTSFVVC